MIKKNKVLFVDDEVNILNSIKRSIIFEDYTSLFALSGEKALEQFKDNEISVIVSDMRMPNMNGLELLTKVKEISPNTIRIVLSGYNQLTQILATVNSVGVFKYITKPWNDEVDFLPAIREAIYYYNLKIENDIMKKELKEKNDKYEDVLKLKDELIKRTELDIHNIKTINNSILQIQNLLFAKLQSNINHLDISAYYLKMINSIYTKFLTTFPTTIETFSIKSLTETFATLTDNKSILDLDNLDFKHNGNLKLILLVTTELFNYILDKNKALNLVVQFRSFPMLSIKFISVNEPLYTYNIEFKLITNFLRELIKTCDGNLILDEKNTNEILILVNTKNVSDN